ncbi:hypothetical protein E2C01_018647 [Portunus trituberculatus]|uniref:Uncharacterized protein n=1 Tax=Portunus trituberculatus TaxID=210409 RepID=A0A5B7DVS4_PORTR|nr:hypothetical protein [Portunus trituberculatus]
MSSTTGSEANEAEGPRHISEAELVLHTGTVLPLIHFTIPKEKAAASPPQTGGRGPVSHFVTKGTIIDQYDLSLMDCLPRGCVMRATQSLCLFQCTANNTSDKCVNHAYQGSLCKDETDGSQKVYRSPHCSTGRGRLSRSFLGLGCCTMGGGGCIMWFMKLLQRPWGRGDAPPTAPGVGTNLGPSRGLGDPPGR